MISDSLELYFEWIHELKQVEEIPQITIRFIQIWFWVGVWIQIVYK